MQIVKRLYIYVVSYISLLAFLIGLENLLRLTIEAGLGLSRLDSMGQNYFRNQYSLFGAIALVGAVVWVIHWRLARKSVKLSEPQAAEETNSIFRKLFIYGFLLTAFFFTVGPLAQVLGTVLAVLPHLSSDNIGWTLSSQIPQVLVFGVGWWLFWRVRTSDNKKIPEADGAATLRRWYFYLVNYLALSFLLYALSRLLRSSWQYISPWREQSDSWLGNNWFPFGIGEALGMAIVYLVVWLWHWRWVQSKADSEEEQHSVLRKVYLYAFIFQAVLVTLTSLAFSFYHLLRLFIGNYAGNASDSLLFNAGDASVNAVIYGLFWFYHWEVIKQDATQLVTEQPRQIAIRSLYLHLVSLISLVVLAVGFARLIRLVTDLVLGGQATNQLTRQTWGDEISNVITFMLVGGTTWLLIWWNLQRKSLAPGEIKLRQEIFRRIYLYLILFGGVVSLLGSGVWLIYGFFQTLLGEPLTGELKSQLSWAFGILLTGAILLVYHLFILMADIRARASQKPEATTAEEYPVQPTAGLPSTNLLFLVQNSGQINEKEVEEVLQAKLKRGSKVELLPVGDLTTQELRDWLNSREKVPSEIHVAVAQRTN